MRKELSLHYQAAFFSLNEEQREAIEKICSSIRKDEHKTYLLYGITGSGKTEIYLQCILESLKYKKGAIFLVPEISLTSQVIKTLKERFGDRIALYHSSLTEKQRFNEWMRIKNGEADIVLGARSAIFAPLERVGVIVVDESHETTYKQKERLRYSAIQAAILRGRLQKSVVIRGSATPTVEAYYKGKKGEYHLISLPFRIDHRQLPEVTVVDMKKEKEEGNRSIISRRLKKAVEETLTKGEQAILFLNRRGFSSGHMCYKCGYMEVCLYCRLSLTYHASMAKLICHHCGYRKDIEHICPQCQGSYMRPRGMGTEKVEKEIKKLFPHSIVQRIDSDTSLRKKSYQEVFNSFTNGKIDILVGTQMIAKGLDFPNVTVVGIISADTQLNLSDFRAAEFTFQLLTQVSGRTGRGEKGGRVIVQTYNPNHYSIRYACSYDFEKFYEEELGFRKKFHYPPFRQLICLTIKGENENRVRKNSLLLAKMLKENHKNVELIGPAPCPIEKIKNKYRWRIVVKNKNTGRVNGLIDHIHTSWKKIPQRKESLIIDVDPIDML